MGSLSFPVYFQYIFSAKPQKEASHAGYAESVVRDCGEYMEEEK